METGVFVAFAVVSVAVIVVPGPSILLIVANSLQEGRVAGLYTVAGVSVAMLIQLAVVLAGLTSLVNTLAAGFDLLRWLGIAYLCYLGLQRWHGDRTSEPNNFYTARQYGSSFAEGFVVALTNPTTLLFFIALFPQFLNTAAPSGPQLLVMALTFWLLALLFDIAYALLAAGISNRLEQPGWVRARNRLSGVIMLAAAVLLGVAEI